VTDTTRTRKPRPANWAPGIDQPGGPNGKYRVRLRFPGSPKPQTEMHADLATANARYWELVAIRAQGGSPADGARFVTLGEIAREVLAAKMISGLTDGGLEWWERILRPLTDGPHADTPVHLLPVSKIRTAHLQRAAQHPKAANDERIGLEHVLRAARADGARVPDALLELPTPVWETRERRVLTPSELHAFAIGAPARYVRLVLLQGMVGNRIGELLTLRRDWIDLDAATITIPAAAHKSGKRVGAKVIPLLPEEAELLREQLATLRVAGTTPTAHLPGTPADSELVWPRPDGTAWPVIRGRVAHSYFNRLVWQPTLTAAGRDDLTSHDLRATAVTTMRDRGISEETCATRVGHADAKLIRSIYDKGSRLLRAQRELRAIHQAEVVATATDTTTATTAAEAN
jgi:integrase